MRLNKQLLNRRLSLFENLIVIIFIAILIKVFIDRVERLMVDAEAAALTTTVSNINSAYYLLVAQLIIHDRLDEAERFAGSNPFELEGLLAKEGEKSALPLQLSFTSMAPNYAGVCGNHAELAPRNWCYEKKSSTLLYRAEHEQFLVGGAEAGVVRFSVQLLYEDNNHDGHFDQRHDRFDRLLLKPLDDYRWNL